MRLGVTRAAERLTVLSSSATAAGIEIVPLPFTQSQPISFHLPDGISLDQVDWLFFTSGNGVRLFFARLDQLGLVLDAHTKIATVGDKTTEALTRIGHVVHFQPTQPVGEALFNQFVEANRDGEVVLWARGKDVKFDPRELFAGSEFEYYSVICYETVPNEVDQRVVASLEDKDYILFTAPSAVRAYDEKFGSPSAHPLAIGPTTASAMSERGWTEFATMKQPDVDRVLEYL